MGCDEAMLGYAGGDGGRLVRGGGGEDAARAVGAAGGGGGGAGARTRPVQSERLEKVVTEAVRGVQKDHPDWKVEDRDIAVTLIDASKEGGEQGSFRGDASIYPASVVKLFYLAYAEQLIADGK